jgi:hypothetical protein
MAMRRHLIFILAALSWLICGCQKAEHWQEYSYPSDGFAISSPYAPVLETTTLQVPQRGPVEMHNYTLSLGRGYGDFLLTTTEVKTVDPNSIKSALEGTKKGFIGNGKLLAEKEISIDGNPGIEFEFEDHSHKLIRCYSVNKRYFQFIWNGSLKQPVPAAVGRIFNSFRLLGQRSTALIPRGQIPATDLRHALN